MAKDKTASQRYFNLRPFVLFAIASVLGVVCTVLSVNYGFLVVLLPFLALTIIGLILVVAKSKELSIYTLIMALLFILTSLVSSIKIANINNCVEKAYPSECMLSGKVVSAKCYGGYYSYILKTPNYNGDKINCNVQFTSEYELSKGDIVSITTSLNPIDKSEYSKFLADNVGFTVNASDIEIVGQSNNLFEKCYLKIKSVIVEHMGEQAPFALALITGDSSLINSNELSNFRFSGVSHIFAVSGLHIGFLVGLISAFFEILKIKREKKAFLVTFIALFYSGICGFTPSSLRATVMSAILLFAKAKGKKYDMLNSISLSMIIILLFNPFDLLSTGFVLSYGCVISICLFYKTFENLLKFMPEKLGGSVALCLSVQFGVSPLVCYYFGYTSIISVLLNLLVVPIIGVVYPFLLIFIVLTIIIKPLAFLLKAPEVILFLVRYVANFFEFEKFNLFFKFSPIIIFLYYTFAIFATEKLNFSKRVKLFSIIASTSFLLVVGV